MRYKNTNSGNNLVDIFPGSSVSEEDVATNEFVGRHKMHFEENSYSYLMERLIKAYTNPIEATVREIVSNALDATVKARKNGENPDYVKITAPTSFSPEFVVEDNGVGMSPRFVHDTLRAFGGTTKRDDLDQIGSHGLGSKSPLAYTDEFYMETTQDGVTTEIVISRLSTGPETNITSVEKTGKNNGTIVRVPTLNNDSDHDLFSKAIDIYKTYAFATDEKIMVDGVLSDMNNDYILVDSVLIEESEDLYGRLWINKNALNNMRNSLTTRYSNDGVVNNIDYVLSGYCYKGLNISSIAESATTFLVELKPGIVEFSTSRDQITVDSKFVALSNLVRRQIFDSDKYFSYLFKAAHNLEKESYYKFLRNIPFSFVDPGSVENNTSEKVTVRFDSANPHKDFCSDFAIDDLANFEGVNFYKDNYKYGNFAEYLTGFKEPYGSHQVLNFENGKLSIGHHTFVSRTIKDSKSIATQKVDNSVGTLPSLFDLSADLRRLNKDHMIHIIHGVKDKQAVSRAFRHRNNNTLSSAYGYHCLHILVRDVIDENMLKALSYRFSGEIVYTPYEDYLENAKSLMRQSQSTTVGLSDDFTDFKVYSVGNFSSFEDFNKIKETQFDQVSIDVREEKEKNSLFVVAVPSMATREVARNTLNGFYSVHGEDALHRDVYFVVDPKKNFFDLVNDKEFLIAPKDYKPRSMISSNLLENRMFARDFHSDAVLNIPLKYRKLSYIAHNFFEDNVKNMVNSESYYYHKTLNARIKNLSRFLNSSVEAPHIQGLVDELTRIGNIDYEEISDYCDAMLEYGYVAVVDSIPDEDKVMLNATFSVLRTLTNSSRYNEHNGEFYHSVMAYDSTQDKIFQDALLTRINDLVVSMRKGDELW